MPPPSVMPKISSRPPGQRRSTSDFNSAEKGALVQNFIWKADRSASSKVGSAIRRWYWTGTSMVWVTACFWATSRKARVSNLRMITTEPPDRRVGSIVTSVVLEYSGVVSSVIPSDENRPDSAAIWPSRIRCEWMIPLGTPVVPDE